MHACVIILDFGSQVTQLIARRVRELNIYCEIHPFNHFDKLDLKRASAVILSGSPASVREANHPSVNLHDLIDHIPVLGICYGAQLTAHFFGGEVKASGNREFGYAQLNQLVEDKIWKGVENGAQIWMSHSDSIVKLPEGYIRLASTEDIQYAAFKSDGSKIPAYFFQFHPEVVHSKCGAQLISNFLLDICGITPDWTPGSYIQETVLNLQAQIGEDEVLLALSGGVDSSVAALLLHKAIGKKLHCFFIDNGLLRKNEFSEVLHTYQDLGLQINGINASQLFYKSLEGLTDPELKRKAIGKSFIDVFEKESQRYPNIKWLAQGTIYPDVIESASVYGPASVIKSHHNVGGLPEKLKLKIIEPLRSLFKDEVRKVGAALQLPENILYRHPFPGPGLAIRIIGEVSPEKVLLLQEADKIFIDNLHQYGLYTKIWQAGAILLPVRSVGVMGDERTYENVVALRAVSSIDGMTADWSQIPHEVLASISNQIINKVKGINRVVYDISSKPPATIEWE